MKQEQVKGKRVARWLTGRDDDNHIYFCCPKCGHIHKFGDTFESRWQVPVKKSEKDITISALGLIHLENLGEELSEKLLGIMGFKSDCPDCGKSLALPSVIVAVLPSKPEYRLDS